MKKSLLDVIFVTTLLVLGYFVLHATPEFAANLSHDGGDYACPAVNFLETGKLLLCVEGDVPPGHPIGMPLMLLPFYVIFGHFVGNGIYLVLLCGLGTLILVYWIGKEICGRVTINSVIQQPH